MSKISKPIYLRDLKEEYQTKSFLGGDIEELKIKARKEDKDIIVGYYVDEYWLDD